MLSNANKHKNVREKPFFDREKEKKKNNIVAKDVEKKTLRGWEVYHEYLEVLLQANSYRFLICCMLLP